MEVANDRISARFVGYTPDGNLLFVETSNSHYFTADAGETHGKSILNLHDIYNVRKIPGNRYLVEGLA